jgi:L-alanine-DL-glutamate epimerase-like enolase superfamily enzyme
LNNKIKSIVSKHYRIPLAEVLYDAKHGNHTHFELITVEIMLESNLTGVGYTYTGGKGGSAIHRLVVDDLAPVLIGQDPDKLEQLWEILNWHVHFVGRGGVASFAIAALDIALWDLRAKSQQLPLWKLLGGNQPEVKAYAGLIDLNYTMEREQEVIAEKLKQGYRGIKIKIGLDDLEQDIRRTRSIRKLIPSNIEFMVDANMKWGTKDAIWIGKALEELLVTWFEEPTLPDDFAAFQRIGEQIQIPLAQGENLHTLLEFQAALQTNVLKFPQPDVGTIGGITPWLQVAQFCADQDLMVSSHGMHELHVSLLAGVPNPGYLEVHSFPINQYALQPFRFSNGLARPPEVIGHGVEFDWNKLQAYEVSTFCIA